MGKLGKACVLLWVVILSVSLKAEEITVAAASDLQFALTDLADRFQKETGNSVKLTFGSSGNFFAQIQNGAPFDIFLSADVDYPHKLESAGLAEPGSLYEYARGKIVIWVRADSKLDLHRGIHALLDPSVGKIAIASPAHAPYGRAAVSAMQSAGVYQRVRDKLVLGENISQTTSFVVAGSADAGIIALSLALAPGMKAKGRYAEIPAAAYPPIRQACVILRSSQKKPIARQFVAFMKRPASSRLLQSYGFVVGVAQE
jgi:molybdate transport system substrate-binding protein